MTLLISLLYTMKRLSINVKIFGFLKFVGLNNTSFTYFIFSQYKSVPKIGFFIFCLKFYVFCILFCLFIIFFPYFPFFCPCEITLSFIIYSFFHISLLIFYSAKDKNIPDKKNKS